MSKDMRPAEGDEALMKQKAIEAGMAAGAAAVAAGGSIATAMKRASNVAMAAGLSQEEASSPCSWLLMRGSRNPATPAASSHASSHASS